MVMMKRTEGCPTEEPRLSWEVGSGGSPDQGGGFFHTCSGEDFAPYRDCVALVRHMIALAEEDAPAAAEETRAALHQVLQGGHPNDLSSESILYSVIRRISRESIGSAALIDSLADKLATLCRLSRRVQGSGPFVFDQAHRMDRPSIRVLSRFLILLDAPSLAMVWRFPAGLPIIDQGAAADPCSHRLYQARARLFGSLLAKLQPHVQWQGKPQVLREMPGDPAAIESRGFLEEAAHGLVTQNFERAYLACYGAMQTAPPHSDHHRVLALIDANLGFIDQAYAELQKAITLAQEGPESAHLHYLSGLLCTKRFYDFPTARAHFTQGFERLTGSTPEERLEEGWLYNGQSFVDTLESIALPAAERAERILGALQREIKAFNVVRSDKGAGPRYLRFNLLTNIAFLLEIQEQFDEAIRFWDRAFGKFMGYGTDAGAEFEKAYLYRIGILAYRSGRIDQALHHLSRAAAIAASRRDRLTGERIWYGLGYVHLADSQWQKATQSFAEGLRLTIAMKDWAHAGEHGTGLIHGLVRAGQAAWTEPFWELESGWPVWKDWLNQVRPALPDQDALEQWLREHPVTTPKTKLPSYIPDIDLEETPPVDINRYLVSHHGEPLRPLRKTAGHAGGANG